MIDGVSADSERPGTGTHAVGPINQDGVSNQVYRRIREAILMGGIAPGDQITTKALAAQLRVSITPVRDALKRLETDGLVEIVQRRGVFVTRVTPAMVRETFQIRMILECAAVDQAGSIPDDTTSELESLLVQMDALRTPSNGYSDYLQYVDLDARFHGRIVDLLENRRLTEIYRGLRWTSQLCLILYRSSDRRAAETLAEHRAIVEALADSHSRARQAVSLHLRHAEDDLLSRIEGDKVRSDRDLAVVEEAVQDGGGGGGIG